MNRRIQLLAAGAITVAAGVVQAGIPVVEPSNLNFMNEKVLGSFNSTEYQELIEAKRQLDAEQYNRAKAEAIRQAQASKANAQPSAAAKRPVPSAAAAQAQPTATQGEKR